jgi:hypothetical protein
MWYACGGVGVSQNHPIDCPQGLTEGAAGCMAILSFEGCCMPNGDNFYCTEDDNVGKEACG